MEQRIYLYDGSWEGLLTVIFSIYRSKEPPLNITSRELATADLFGEPMDCPTVTEEAERVAKRLRAIDASFFRKLYRAFLSERPEREMLIYRLVKLALAEPQRIKGDYRQPDLLRLKQFDKEIGREVHRMHAFVRFQRLADGLWFAAIEPDFDVLPLIGKHFRLRYADQPWLIYDPKRRYGLHFDLKELSFVTLNLEKSILPGELPPELLHEEEKAYQQLWQDYFSSVNIPARRNMKLHLQQLPQRYWKYLFEKA